MTAASPAAASRASEAARREGRGAKRNFQGGNVQAIERLLKTAIVDKTPSVASAALVSSYHLLPIAKDVVRRWANETQEAALSGGKSSGFSLGFGTSSSNIPQGTGMAQYHAIGLLYQMRAHDRMALVKMVQQFSTAKDTIESISNHSLVAVSL